MLIYADEKDLGVDCPAHHCHANAGVACGGNSSSGPLVHERRHHKAYKLYKFADEYVKPQFSGQDYTEPNFRSEFPVNEKPVENSGQVSPLVTTPLHRVLNPRGPRVPQNNTRPVEADSERLTRATERIADALETLVELLEKRLKL